MRKYKDFNEKLILSDGNMGLLGEDLKTIYKTGGIVFIGNLQVGEGIYWLGKLEKQANRQILFSRITPTQTNDLLRSLEQKTNGNWILVKKDYHPTNRISTYVEFIVRDGEGNLFRISDPDLKELLGDLNEGDIIPPEIEKELRQEILLFAAVL